MGSSRNCLTFAVVNLHVNGGSYTPSDQSISSNRLEALELIVGVLLGAHRKIISSVLSSPALKSMIYWMPALLSWLSSEHKRVCIIISLKAYHAKRLTVGNTASTVLKPQWLQLKQHVMWTFHSRMLDFTVGHGGALVESIAFNRSVVGSTPALAAM